MLCKCSSACWLHKRFRGSGRTSGKVLVFLPCCDCCWGFLGWSSAEQKEDLPCHRGCGEKGARGTAQAWGLLAPSQVAAVRLGLHFLGLEQPKGSSTLAFFPISKTLLLFSENCRGQNVNWISCPFKNCWFCSFGKALSVPIAEFVGLLARLPNCHVAKWFS